MADGTTTVLGLTKPEVGASTDTWGPKLNDNFDDIDALFDTGAYLKLAKGGTGAGTAAGARTNLGLGSMATQAASAVAITGGSISGVTLSNLASALAIASGGTGATTAAGARTALGLGGLAVLSTVGASEITDGSVGASELASDAVTTVKILDANVIAAKLASDSVTTAKILNSNVTTAKIADSNVTTAKIADSNVTTAKIADANITPAKLSGAQSGSAPIFGIRAWVSFNGNTASIRGSGNIASVTRTSAGNYKITFTTAMQDANYAIAGGAGENGWNNYANLTIIGTPTTTYCEVGVRYQNGGSPVATDTDYVTVMVIR